MINKKIILAFSFLLMLLSPSVGANVTKDASLVVSVDVLGYVWIAICCALVLFMQAGFLLLEAGMVRSKNTINVILKNFTDIGLGTLGFWLVGFGLMFGVNDSGWLGLSGFMPVSIDNLSTLNLLYQLMFAATAATIVSGAVAERFSFLPYIGGTFLITIFIYPVFGAWVWGGTEASPGWLRGLGFYDMAGGTVVHSIGAWCALSILILIGPRHGRYSRKGAVHDIPGHNLPYVAVGGFILWLGWFGFNGGAVNDDFSNLGVIVLNTHLGAIGGIIGAIFWLLVTKKGFYITRIINGALGGLVSITAGADVIAPQFVLLVGLIAGVIVVSSHDLLGKFKIDDVVGAIPVHGFCGAWGTLSVGLFYSGDLFNIERIITQIIGIFVAFIWGLAASYALFWLLNRFKPVRVSTKFEQRGLDISEHKEIGYSDFMTVHVRADK